MERLTKRLPSGAADYNYPASCYFDDDSGLDRIAQSAFRQRCVERLADYEDIRLTPEQCKNAKVIIESAFSNDTSKAERIRELLKADEEGRLVVLREVSDAPAADVAPVRHGRWDTGRFNLETGNYEEQCTHCRNFSKEYDKPYCPNCGAKMNGGADLEDD